MTKEELIQQVEEIECVLVYLEEKISKSKKIKKSRKDEVLEVLQSHSRIKVGDIATELNISSRNVSSYLTYLRRDGYEIITDSKGRKMLLTD